MPKGLSRRYGQHHLHFITCSCYRRLPLFASARSKNLFVKILGEVRARLGFQLIGYVVMPEHVHLLIDETPKALPAKVIQVLKQRVSRRLRGKRRSAQGQLALQFPGDPGDHRRFWQRRYYDFNVYSEKKLREKLDYMHANPVTRNLVDHPI
jgi:putative transposase